VIGSALLLHPCGKAAVPLSLLQSISQGFSRRPGGRGEVVGRLLTTADQPLEDRVGSLKRADRTRSVAL
jgi:hypothetical protein